MMVGLADVVVIDAAPFDQLVVQSLSWSDVGEPLGWFISEKD